MELEHRLAATEGESVMKDADKLDGEMAGVFASLRSGLGSFLKRGKNSGGGDDGGGAPARDGGRGRSDRGSGAQPDNGSGGGGEDVGGDGDGRRVSALKSSYQSMVNKRTARGSGGGGGKHNRVGFVDDKEQARLDAEGELAARLQQVNRANDELMAQLAACEARLHAKRLQMKMAKSSFEAVSARCAAETTRREKAEDQLERARAGYTHKPSICIPNTKPSSLPYSL